MPSEACWIAGAEWIRARIARIARNMSGFFVKTVHRLSPFAPSGRGRAWQDRVFIIDWACA